MPHPWVYSATTTPDGKMQFKIEVTDLHTTVGAIEISGMATQVDGAFAPIYRITDIPKDPEVDQDHPEKIPQWFVYAEADPTPDHVFRANEDVTVFVRVSKVWVTVLGPGSDDGPEPDPKTAQDNPKWEKHRADTHISAPDGAIPVSSITIAPPS